MIRIISISFILFFALNICISAQNIQLNSVNYTLNIDKKGILSIAQRTGTDISTKTSLQKLWRITMQNTKEGSEMNPKKYTMEPSADFEVRQQQNEIVLIYKNLKVDNRQLPLNVEFKIFLKDDAFCFSGTLSSTSEEWIIRDLTYPIISGIHVSDDQLKIYWPDGLGECYHDPVAFGHKSFGYPGGKGDMSWFSINSAQNGLYMACHDPERSMKNFELEYNTKDKTFVSSVNFPVFTNTFIVPEVQICPYLGKWFEASKRYRTFYDKNFKMPVIPDWVKKDAGWFLVILKQQNGHAMWKYSDIDKLVDIALERNITTIGLFGWANGGHDYLYPNYIPDDLMGGPQVLKAAIERAHQRGVKIILYANGCIMDTSTEFYRYNGNQTMVLSEEKTPNIQSIRKFNSATPVVFAQGSFSSKLWRKTMLDLALQAHELGADGILYDQVGVGTPFLNFSKLQDHKLPQETCAKYKFQMLNEIRTTLKKLNPDFVIMTEGTNDGVITDIDYFHGWGTGSGTYSSENNFPEMMKYTFPELVKTQRIGSPVVSRKELCYATVFGLRHEIECRYDADVDYLTKGIMPSDNAYSDAAYYPPSPGTIREVPKDEATKFEYDLIQFENENAEFLRYGKFIADEGIEYKGNDLVVNGFKNGDRIGVMIWNKNLKEDRPVEVSVKGYRLIVTKEPQNGIIVPGSLLQKNSLRLMVFTKE